MYVGALLTPLLSFSVRLLPAPDIALARHALAAAASAAPVLPPQGHLISPWREYGDVASNEELGHLPATLILRTMRPRTVRALSFQNLAEREAQHRQWRCEYEKPGERIQVFQVEFDNGDHDGGRPSLYSDLALWIVGVVLGVGPVPWCVRITSSH